MNSVPTTDASANGQPTAAELLAVVTAFLESQIMPALTDPYGNAEVSAAINALRIVEREMLGSPAASADSRNALAGLGFSDEAQLAEAIRNGDLDDRAEDVATTLRALVIDRLAIDRPGYQDE